MVVAAGGGSAGADTAHEPVGDGHPAAARARGARRRSSPRSGRRARRDRRRRSRVESSVIAVVASESMTTRMSSSGRQRVHDADTAAPSRRPTTSTSRTTVPRPARGRSTREYCSGVQPRRRNSTTESSGSMISSVCGVAAISVGRGTGDLERRLDRVAVGVGAVRGEAEPERQPAGPPRQVVGEVGRVPGAVVRRVVLSTSPSATSRTARRPAAHRGTRRAGCGRPGRRTGRGRSGRTSRTARTTTCADRR